MDRFPIGSVHGRFQPLHLGHLEYIAAAKERCKYLWIGITQYDIRAIRESPQDTHREEPANNPLTYYERVDIIAEALVDEEMSRSEFSIHPFPIDTPAHLHDFIPTAIPIFTTVYDNWNRHKVQLLREQGYTVIVLYERKTKEIDGVTIRKAIRDGDPKWMRLVPSATIKAVKKYKMKERLLELC